jgi:hypothetical protein
MGTGKLKRKQDKLKKTKEQYLDEVRNKPGTSRRETRKGDKYDKTAKQVSELKKGPGKKGDIKIDPKNEGKFGAWIKKNMPGKDTCSAASAVMKNKKKYTTRVVKMANFANNMACKK